MTTAPFTRTTRILHTYRDQKEGTALDRRKDTIKARRKRSLAFLRGAPFDVASCAKGFVDGTRK
jgi:hypothetical protein